MDADIETLWVNYRDTAVKELCDKEPAVEKILKDDLGEFLFDTKIRRNTKAASSPGVQETIFDYEASEEGRGTQDYTKLAAELVRRIEWMRSGRGLAANE